MSRIPAVILATLIASVVRPGPAPGQAVKGPGLSPARAGAVDEVVRAELAAQKLVGVAVGVIEDGRIAYLKGYGLADRERGVPVTEETVFNWASVSKPMAAVLALQLVERGKLDLDADVRRYVPEFPAKRSPVTCRQLLCHQGGIPHYSNGQIIPIRREIRDDRLDPVLSIDRFGDSPLIFTPGEKEDYSSYGYVLLSAVIQRAGDQPYDAQVRDRIAGPLGMSSLQLDGAGPRPGWAVGYARLAGTRVVPAPEEVNDWKFGAGGYKSNIRDLARFAEALIGRRLVSAETERTMWTPQRLADGTTTRNGLGFVVEGEGRGLKVSHNGSQRETATRMVFYPGSKKGVVVLCNSSFADPARISTAVFSALSREP